MYRYPADIQRGIILLEELYKRPDEGGNRDFIYYLAIGNARLKVNSPEDLYQYVLTVAWTVTVT